MKSDRRHTLSTTAGALSAIETALGLVGRGSPASARELADEIGHEFGRCLLLDELVGQPVPERERQKMIKHLKQWARREIRPRR